MRATRDRLRSGLAAWITVCLVVTASACGEETQQTQVPPEAVGTPTFTNFTPVSYTIATVTTAGNVQLNGTPFPTTPTTTGFTFSSSTIQFGLGSASLMASGTNLLLTFTPVPEAAHALLACGAAAGAAGWWRRRRT